MKKNGRVDALKGPLSRNIRSLRVHSGLSQEELAEKAGISVPYLGAIERGEKWPGSVILGEIANGLEVEPYVLLMPESTSSIEVRKVVDKLAVDISALVNQSMKMLNNIARENGSPGKKKDN
jgi:transcriptional regulator with XRE-family HTH domain